MWSAWLGLLWWLWHLGVCQHYIAKVTVLKVMSVSNLDVMPHPHDVITLPRSDVCPCPTVCQQLT